MILFSSTLYGFVVCAFGIPFLAHLTLVFKPKGS